VTASRLWRGGLVLLAAAAPLQPSPIGAGSAAEAMRIEARPITQFRIGSAETRFGGLEFVGGLELTSRARDFGSLSAFRFLEAGGAFIGVSDAGLWYSGRVERDEEARPAGFADFRMQPIADEGGADITEKWLADAEALAVKDGVATAGFERAHRISEYSIGREMGPPLRSLDFVVPAGELRQNRGFETIAYAPGDGRLAGARVAISEKSLDRLGNIFAAIIEGPGKGLFTVARSGAFDITDGAFLPGGDMLVLERSFSMAAGVRMRLRRLDESTIRKGAVADGEILLEADMSHQIDNMEGLDIWRRQDGALMVSIVSDDNHSLLQRNLYLEFRLAE
jgi:hypothetical protein